jgi:ribosomal protein L24E
MATTTILKKKEPYCLWCDSAKPATKAGWIKYLFSNGTAVRFCSKKCLASATLGGKGKILDAGKIAALFRRRKRSAVSARLKRVLEKDRMDEEDYGPFFGGLGAKQKRTLALVGLATLMGQFFYNPEKILAEIDRIGRLK